jgi:pimeloyl-ACP methyl ester carboxylesterase
MQAILALSLGQDVAVPYTIVDMAEDAVGLLDALHVEKAHVCGMSMGGFIAQTFATNNPSRTLSLTSIYSTTGNRIKFPPTPAVAEAMMVPVPREREPYIEYMVDFYRLTYGTGLPFDEDFHKALFGQAYDRSLCPEGSLRQLLAIAVQEDRTSTLGVLKIPTLIIHGDADPLVPLAGGQATADAIPGAKLMVIKGMGHATPNMDAYWDRIKDAIIEHMEKAA